MIVGAAILGRIFLLEPVTPKAALALGLLLVAIFVLSLGAPAAANILTFEAISYQAKGVWATQGNTGSLIVQEVYAGGPPYPGGRVA